MLSFASSFVSSAVRYALTLALGALWVLALPAAAQSVAGEADLPRLVQQWVDHEVHMQQVERTDAVLHFSARVGAVDARVRLAPCARVEVYLPPGSRLWGATRVGARCQEGAVRWNVSLPATVRVMGPAWVLRRDVAMGSALADADVEESEVDWAADASPVLAGPQAWQGQQALRSLVAGATLRQSSVRAVQVFQAGAEVTVLVDGGSFQISASGWSLTPGVIGQPAKVKLDSGRILTVKVLDGRTVRADI
jgi:flagellar basal body P-ring formation protein FlgA